MVQAIERAVLVPALKVAVHRAARRQVLRNGIPLATGAEYIHQPVDHFPDVHRALVAAGLRRRDQWRYQGPLRIRQVTRVAELAPIVESSIFARPHRHPQIDAQSRSNRTNPPHASTTRNQLKRPTLFPDGH